MHAQALLSLGGVVVSQPAHPRDAAEFEGMVIFEPRFCNTSWSAETTALLASPARLTAWHQRAQAPFRFHAGCALIPR